MSHIIKASCAAFFLTVLLFASNRSLNAQDPVVINTVTPVVVGHTAEPAGLFGLRVRYRPVVAPMITPVAVTPVRTAPVVVRPVTVIPTVKHVVVETRTVVESPRPTMIEAPKPVVYYTPHRVIHSYPAPPMVLPPVTYIVR